MFNQSSLQNPIPKIKAILRDSTICNSTRNGCTLNVTQSFDIQKAESPGRALSRPRMYMPNKGRKVYPRDSMRNNFLEEEQEAYPFKKHSIKPSENGNKVISLKEFFFQSLKDSAKGPTGYHRSRSPSSIKNVIYDKRSLERGLFTGNSCFID
jgi:hypothetical protein